MKIKLLKKAVILLMISFTIGTLSSCSKDGNSSPKPKISKEAIFVFKTRLEAGMDQFTFNLGVDSKVDSVDWGDGDISKGEKAHSHEYKENKEYTVKVYAPSNSKHEFDLSNGTEMTPKVELVSITDNKTTSVKFTGTLITKIDNGFLKGVPELNSAPNMFNGCTSLTEIPSDLLKYNTKIVNASSMFAGCTALDTIPQDLLKYNTEITEAQYMFKDCSSLKEVPSELLKYNTKITDVSYMFEECTSINTIPSDLLEYGTKITTARDMFEKCTSLNKIPDGLLSNNIPNLSYMFEGCTALTGLSDDLFKGSKVKDASYMFKACTGLLEGSVSTTLVKVIADINKIEGMFNGCSNLTFDKNFEVLSSDKKTSIFKI